MTSSPSKTTSHNVLILKFPYSSMLGGGEKHTITLVEKLSGHSFYLLSTCSVLIPEFTKRKWHNKKIWAGTEPVTPLALLLFCITAPFITLNLLRWSIVYKYRYNITTVICLSLTEKVLLTPWLRLLGIKVIWIEHLQIERWLIKSPLRLLYVLWSRLVTVVAVVEAVKQQLVQLGVSEQHVTVIYNSIDVSHYAPQPSDPRAVQQQYQVLYVGRLAKEKGIDDLIRAIKQLRNSVPAISLTIVGEGYWRADLEALVQELGLSTNVRFTGFQSHIQRWLAESDVVVLPSTRRETFGIVIAEALAMMKPVIVTTCGGVQEVVGSHGWVVEPHAPDQIAQALEAVYTDYESALEQTKHGRARVVELFQESRMIQEYDQLFS